MNDKELQALTALAEKLNTTAEYLWGVLVQQAYISFWTDIVQYLITVVVVYFAIRFCSFAWKTSEDNTYDVDKDFGFKALSIISGIIATILIIAFIFSIEGTITKIANPEYWALKQIVSTMK